MLDNTNLTATTREQIGWYLSYKHNGELDGNVTQLLYDTTQVSINPDNNITFRKGTNGLIMDTFNNCTQESIRVDIKTTPALSFEPSFYTIHCTSKKASQWTGIGKTGNILEITPKVNKSGKMEW